MRFLRYQTINIQISTSKAKTKYLNTIEIVCINIFIAKYNFLLKNKKKSQSIIQYNFQTNPVLKPSCSRVTLYK